MSRDFKNWLDNFKESIATYNYYIDFDVVYKNYESVKVELNILNSLVGSKNIEKDFETLVAKYPEVLKCIPILLAKREMEIFCMDSKGIFKYRFDKMNYSVAQYSYFMKETGLFELISNRIVNNIVDYVLGVETGLNTNGRKNRGGHLMEDLIEFFLIDAGFVKGETYYKEMFLSELEKLTGLDLSALSNHGSAEKKFDFVFITDNCVYASECNFYQSGGSKLNETARSYKTLALESKGIKGFKFVWFTDGKGWKSAKNNLKETFDVLDTMYNLNDLEQGVLKVLIEEDKKVKVR